MDRRRARARTLAPLAPRALLAVLALGPSAAAGVWTVAPSGGDFTQISSAVLAAQDGDVILVEPSGGAPYGGFTVDGKSLVISNADPGVTVATHPIRIRNLAAGQSCVLRGFVVTALSSPIVPGIDVVDCAGAVRVEDCSLTGSSPVSLGSGGEAGLQATGSADVGLTHCQVKGGHGASSFTNDWDAANGGAGLVLLSSTAWVHQSELQGGNGGDHGDPDIIEGDNYEVGDGGPGAQAYLGSTLTVAGSVLRGGYGGVQIIGASKSLGGPGIYASNDSLLRVRDNVYVPGKGTQKHVIIPEIEADPSDVLVIHWPARELQTESPLRAGTTANFLLIGDNGDLNVAPVSLAPKGHWFGGFAGPLLVDPTNLTVLTFGVTPASGELVLSFAVPALPVSLHHLELHVQLATVHEGSVTLENGSAIVLLDSTF